MQQQSFRFRLPPIGGFLTLFLFPELNNEWNEWKDIFKMLKHMFFIFAFIANNIMNIIRHLQIRTQTMSQTIVYPCAFNNSLMNFVIL